MRYLLCLMGLVVLTACDSHPATQAARPPTRKTKLDPLPPTAAASADSARRRAALAEEDTLAALRREKLLPHQLGYHRYRGRVGSRAVVLELTVSREYAGAEAECAGKYYDSLRGQEQSLSIHRFWPHQPLRLAEYDSVGRLAAIWLTDQPLGPVLTGQCRVAGSRQGLPFRLHEDYRGGVRYELLTQHVDGRPLPPEINEAGDIVRGSFTASCERTYLHLMGPDTLRPALRHLQCPTPARVRASLRAHVRSPDGDSEYQDVDEAGVLLNDYELFGCINYVESYARGGAHPLHNREFASFDLRTGRRLTYATVFRPGYKPALRRLLWRYLPPRDRQELREWRGDSRNSLDSLGVEAFQYEELTGGLGLTPDGWYLEADLGSYVMGPSSITVPYAELLPLLRPASPVARMLRERGLWPKAQPH